LLLYWLLGWGEVMWMEAIPVWLIQKPEDGGLGFGTDGIGTVFSIVAIIVIIYNILLYAKISTIVGGPLYMYRYSAAIYMVLISITPFINAFTFLSAIWVKIIIIIHFSFLDIVGSSLFTSVFQLIANAVPKSQLGSLNGVSQSGVALMRSFSPVISTTLISWTLTNGLPFPLDYHFTFFILSLNVLIYLCISFVTPKSINNRI